MKKKTIKSYFFNMNTTIYKNPSVNTLFCFSKRSTKYKKQLNRIHKINKKTKSLPKNLLLYKFYINNLIMYDQWLRTKTILHKLFLNSFYINKAKSINLKSLFKKKKKVFTNFFKKVYFWYKLKTLFHKNLLTSLSSYPDTGMLSSHFVHFLSKKNVVYQTRSKYRSKIVNMNYIYYYLYLYSKCLHWYLQTLDWNLYFFTSNPSKQRVLTDVNFNTNISNWNSNNQNLDYNTQINFENYNVLNYNNIVSKKTLINQYYNEIDIKKKEILSLTINTILEHDIEILLLVQLLYETQLKHTKLYSLNVFEMYKLYNYL